VSRERKFKVAGRREGEEIRRDEKLRFTIVENVPSDVFLLSTQ
jgi:hypothetical protein